MSNPTLDQRAIEGAIARLAGEFGGVFSPETVERYVADCLTRPLFRGGRVAMYIPVLLERFARDRLRAIARLEGVLPTDRPQVLFVCVRNAGRSQMAAALAHVLSGGAVTVYSAGSDPGEHIHPPVVEAMAELGIDIAHEAPKPLADEVVAVADVVVTMGFGDACPIYPGKRYLDWTIADPADRSLLQVRAICDDIRRRVQALLHELNVPVIPR